jgi:Arc/MetJ-type ribon-helix-helix transcriptional regulator
MRRMFFRLAKPPEMLGKSAEACYLESRRRSARMTIQLPHELESSIQAAVHSGRFASVDDAMTAAVRLLLREIKETPPAALPADDAADPLLGSMRDAADELDGIVADAMKRRRDEPWRTISVE